MLLQSSEPGAVELRQAGLEGRDQLALLHGRQGVEVLPQRLQPRAQTSGHRAGFIPVSVAALEHQLVAAPRGGQGQLGHGALAGVQAIPHDLKLRHVVCFAQGVEHQPAHDAARGFG
ncbi:hypothetical protein D9M68_640840 [compost metagenome]